MANSSAARDALRECEEMSLLIEINSDHLERLRNNSSRSGGGGGQPVSELTRQEIRTMEGKLVKHFSKQLALRTRWCSQQAIAESEDAASVAREILANYPSLAMFLVVAGVSAESKSAILARVASLEALKEIKTESDLKRLLLMAETRLSTTLRTEDLRRLSGALKSLRKYTDVLLHDGLRPAPDASKMELHWDSWPQQSCNGPFPTTPSSSSASISKTPSTDSPKDDAPSPAAVDCVAGGGGVGGSNPVAFNRPLYGSHRTNADSAASSLSSSSSAASSLPPPSPGIAGLTTAGPPFQQISERCRATPPTTPPWSATSIFGKKQSFPSTPPPAKKHSTVSSGGGNAAALVKAAAAAAAAAASGQKKHSAPPLSCYPTTQECELGTRINTGGSASEAMLVDSTVNTYAQMSTRTVTSDSGLCSNMDPFRSPPSSADANSSDSTFSLVSTPSTSGTASGASSRRKHLTAETAVLVDEEGGAGSGDPIQTHYRLPPPPSPLDGGVAQISTLPLPKSPCTPRSMGHAIRHRFKKTMRPGKCDLCEEYMFNGRKCTECKYKCHKDCEHKVPPACGLPEELQNLYLATHLKNSPIMTSRTGFGGGGLDQSDGTTTAMTRHFHPGGGGGGGHHGKYRAGDAYPPYPDSSSNTSSCNSSAPASPAVMVTSAPTPPHSANVFQRDRGGATKFIYPDPPMTLPLQCATTAAGNGNGNNLNAAAIPRDKVTSPNPIIGSVKSYDSDKTLSGSSGSAGTAYRLDSQDSTASVDGDAASSSNTWNSGRQPSVSLREWDIPYEDLTIGEKIGSGRFSTVHQGNWHGDVAIKILNTDYLDDEATLEAFRLDVTTFRKTRHENLILFMGACMNPPKLAIVTSLCKGNTLYTHLHLRKDKFSMNKLVIIAQQIAQGMGYLHHRGIVHKDLKTKNIFLENGHAIIADFGLVNVARRLCARHAVSAAQKESMSIPKGWLCYLAPEIMTCLRVNPTGDEESNTSGGGGGGGDLPFTKASDMFAFGTVWYELLTAEWPWKMQPPESIIWLVGKGMKPSLANLQASREVKDILLMCWTFKPEHRPDFAHLSNTIDKLPKKKGLSRSLSQSNNPTHLSRSAESVF